VTNAAKVEQHRSMIFNCIFGDFIIREQSREMKKNKRRIAVCLLTSNIVRVKYNRNDEVVPIKRRFRSLSLTCFCVMRRWMIRSPGSDYFRI